jgi:hypothetical protein
MAPKRHRNKLFYVNHSKTGEVEVVRADDYARRSRVSVSPPPQHLHYTGSDRSHVCRCPTSTWHVRSFSVASDSTHLAANITRFLDQYNLNACSLADFRINEARQESEWADGGVCIENFHYATKAKDVVCHCQNSNYHGRGPVRNGEIMELCAKFFSSNKSKLTCTKVQWRACGTTPWISSLYGDFTYNPRSTRDNLQEHKTKEHNNVSLPVTQPDITHPQGEENEPPGIPKYIWLNARPSAWISREGSKTTSSTPLGTAATPNFPPADGAQTVRGSRPQPLKHQPRVSNGTVWSTIQQDAAGRASEVSPELSLGGPDAGIGENSACAPVDMKSPQYDISNSEGCINCHPPGLWNSGHSGGSSESFELGSSIFIPPSFENYDSRGTRRGERKGPERENLTTLDHGAIPAELPVDRLKQSTPIAVPQELDGIVSQTHAKESNRRSKMRVERSNVRSQDMTPGSGRLSSMFQKAHVPTTLPD